MIEFLNQSTEITVVLIFMWVVLGSVIEGIIAEKYTNEILIWVPKVFYDDVKMNWFGSWFCFILFIVINPSGFLIKLLLYFIVCLCYLAEFIKWLFTVRRK